MCRYTRESVVAQTTQFQRVCELFDRCRYRHAQHACVYRYVETDWSHKRHNIFLYFVLALIAWKLILEVVKVVLLVHVMRQHRIPAPHVWTNVLKTSPFLPLLRCVGLRWQRVLTYQSQHLDYIVSFVWQTMSLQLPMTVLTFVYYSTVLQTGLDTLGIVSLISGLVLGPLYIFRAFWSWFTLDPKQAVFSGTLSASGSRSTYRAASDTPNAHDAGGMVPTALDADLLVSTADPWRHFAFQDFDSMDRPEEGDSEDLDPASITPQPIASSTAAIPDSHCDGVLSQDHYTELTVPDYHRALDA
jgi:hypothetical protein